MSDEMNQIEILNAVKNIALMARTLYDELVEQQFTEAQALTLVGKYLHGTAGGKLES